MTKIGSYDYKGLVQSYLRQDRPTAKTAAGRLSYSGPELISYSSLIAKLDRSKNILTINSDYRHYSKTTSYQIRLLIAAAKTYSYTLFTNPLSGSLINNCKFYEFQISTAVLRYKRGRKYQAIYKSYVFALVHEYKQYLTFTHSSSKELPDSILRLLFVNQLLGD